MPRREKERIETNPTPAGLNNALAGLQASGLPAGEDNPSGPAVGRAERSVPVRPARLGRVVLRRETAHRGGKTVIVVDGFEPKVSGAAIEDLGRLLRKSVGCGGTVRGRAIELQGDQPGKVRALLEAEGFRVAGVR